jgi:hypothetical protein
VTVTPPSDDAAIDPADDALNELGQNMVPTPDDLLGDLSPITQVWYLRELAYSVMRTLAATLAIDGADELPDDSPPVRTLAVVSTVAGELDGAAILVGLLPDDYASDRAEN